MPTGQTGSPMTYMLNGKQYIGIAIGGPPTPGNCSHTGCPSNQLESNQLEVETPPS